MDTQNCSLYIKQSNGRYALANTNRIMMSANELVASIYCHGESLLISSPQIARDEIISRMQMQEECFLILFLNSKHHLFAEKKIVKGSRTYLRTNMKMLVTEALNQNAAAAIIAQNYLSGYEECLLENKAITEDLYKSLAIVGIKLLDHFVVSDSGCLSMAEMGTFA